MSILSPSSSMTCSGRVGLIRPERLALGAAIGRPAAFSRASARGWRAHGEAVEPGAAQEAGGAVRPARQHQGQRPRPEPIRQQACLGRHPDQRARLIQIRHMDDQRVEARPALGGEDRRGRGIRGGVAAEPVDRLGRKGDEPPGADQRRGTGDVAADQGGRLLVPMRFPNLSRHAL
jgi:hypothetical protein